MICGFDECAKDFEPHRHNQKYCSSECCKHATNKRIREKYLEEKKRLRGDKRVCSEKNCQTVLSRYSESTVCSQCLAIKNRTERQDLIRMING